MSSGDMVTLGIVGKTKLLFIGAIAPLGVIAILVFIACSPTRSGERTPIMERNVIVEAEFKRLVTEYVRRTRGWRDDSYKVEPKGHKGKILVFWVIHKDDNPLVPGGGQKSFEVLVDKDAKRIDRELGFQ